MAKKSDLVFCDDCQKEIKIKESIIMGDDTICIPCAQLDAEQPIDYFIGIKPKNERTSYRH